MNILQTTPKSSFEGFNAKLSDALKLKSFLAGFGLETSIFVQDDRINQVVPYDNYYLDQSPTVVGNFLLRQPGSDENHNVNQTLNTIENKSTPFEMFCQIWITFKTGYDRPEMWFFNIQEFRDAVNGIIVKKLG